LEKVDYKVDVFVGLEDNKITFRSLGTFTLMPKQIEFVKGFKLGTQFVFSALPDGKITYFKPYKAYNGTISNGNTAPLHYDIERKKHYDGLNLELFALLLSCKPIIDEDSKNFVKKTHKEMYSYLFGRHDKRGDEDNES